MNKFSKKLMKYNFVVLSLLRKAFLSIILTQSYLVLAYQCPRC